VAPVRHERGIDLRKGKTPSFECGRRTPIISPIRSQDCEGYKPLSAKRRRSASLTWCGHFFDLRQVVAADRTPGPNAGIATKQQVSGSMYRNSQAVSGCKLSQRRYARNGIRILNWDARIQSETPRSPLVRLRSSEFDRYD
jgi:hypothetical protein